MWRTSAHINILLILFWWIGGGWFSLQAEKYVRRGRLDWPDGAMSWESIKATMKLPRLQVWMHYFVTSGYIWFIHKEHVPEICAICKPMNLLRTHFCATSILLFPWQNLVMQHVDHSAGDIIDLLQGLLRHDPANRLTAHEALRHPFFTRYRRFWVESSIILSYVDIGNDLLSERVELAGVGSWIAFNYHVTVFLDFVREWVT